MKSVRLMRFPNVFHLTLLALLCCGVLACESLPSGNSSTQQAAAFKAACDVSGIFLAKLDGTAKGGIVVAIREGRRVLGERDSAEKVRVVVGRARLERHAQRRARSPSALEPTIDRFERGRPVVEGSIVLSKNPDD